MINWVKCLNHFNKYYGGNLTPIINSADYKSCGGSLTVKDHYYYSIIIIIIIKYGST